MQKSKYVKMTEEEEKKWREDFLKIKKEVEREWRNAYLMVLLEIVLFTLTGWSSFLFVTSFDDAYYDMEKVWPPNPNDPNRTI